jgi:uncharacterized repeat protein (TIGR01451 family)
MFAWRHALCFALLVSAGCASGKLTLNGTGSGTDFDRHAKRLEVRPAEASAAVGKQMLLIATIYDEDNKPRRKRRVEWKIEGPGIIFAVDEGGYLQGRGFKEDSKSAVTFTDTTEHALPANIENPLGQIVRPGQSWCVITAAVEGDTFVTVYAPEIGDPDRNRVVAKTHWVDARWQFPESSISARAGAECVLTTKLDRRSDQQPAAGYRVRYRLLDDGQQASIFPAGGLRAGTPKEVVVSADGDGLAKAAVAALKPEFGSNRVGVEIIKADNTVVARAETKIDWQAPQVKLSIDAPKAAQLNQPLPITYTVVSAGSLETLPMVLKASVPPGMDVVSTSPKATQDGDELLWSLPALPGGKQHGVQAVFRPTRVATAITSATVRTGDNLRSDNSASIVVTEARLQVALAGPQFGLVGEKLPFQITIRNPGSGPATNVKVQAQFDAGLEVLGKPGPFQMTIDKLDGGQTQNIALPLTPRQAGRSAVKATVVADGGLQAETSASAIDVKKPELKLEAYGPARGYLNQEVTWTVRVFNPSEVPLANVKVRAVLPADVAFRKATADGRHANGVVEWNLGTAVGKQWTDLQVTAVANRLSPKSVLTVAANASPLANRDGEFRPVAMARPFVSELQAETALEILGVPALQLEAFDSADPVPVGQKFTYTIRVRNTGTLPAAKVEVSAELPPQVKALNSFGLGNGKIDGQKVTFPVIEAVQPGLVSVFTIEVQAVSEGDGRFRAEAKSLSLGTPIRAEEPTRILAKPENPRR